MKFENLSALLECSANPVPRIETLKKYVDFFSEMGYTEFYLGITNAYKIESEPYFCYKRAGYTVEQLQEIDAYSKSKNIELRCTMQTLAHLYPLYRHYKYREIMDTNSILLAGDERVYELIDKMFDTISRGISSRHIHIGFDEAFGLGTGKYFEKNGYVPKKRILLEHLKRIEKIAAKYGLICDIWHDTLLSHDASGVSAEDIKRELSKDTRLFYWNYRENNEELLKQKLNEVKKYSDNVAYCGSAFKICGFGPKNDYSISRIIPQMRVSEEMKIKQYMVSAYGDRGAWSSYYSVMPSFFVAAEFAHGRCTGLHDLDKDKFFRIFGVRFDDMIALDYLNNPAKKEVIKIGNRSSWMFMSDCLTTSYDMFSSPDLRECYERLSAEYESIESGQFSHVFKMSAAAARVLAIKATLATSLRGAYEKKDRTVLEKLLPDCDLLIERLYELKTVFTEYWKKDNYSFGVEVNHLYIGYQITRIEYIKQCIIDYINEGKPIEELDEPALLPSVDPTFDEDSLFVYEFDFMLTHGLLE